MNASLREFARDHRRTRPATSSRVAASVLTALLYGCFALLLGQPAFWVMPDKAKLDETVLRLLPDAPNHVSLPPPGPFIPHLTRPRTETIAAPIFTIASDAPAAPAQLPASAAKTWPLDGGTPAGTGTATEAPSATGGNGTGASLAACLDATWMQAVTDQVRRFFYYPSRAHHEHITGLVIVHFLVLRNGQLDMLEVGTSSGQDVLDAAALDMVRMAAPLPQIPDRMHTEKVNAMLPIYFGRDPNLTPDRGDCSG